MDLKQLFDAFIFHNNTAIYQHIDAIPCIEWYSLINNRLDNLQVNL